MSVSRVIFLSDCCPREAFSSLFLGRCKSGYSVLASKWGRSFAVISAFLM